MSDPSAPRELTGHRFDGCDTSPKLFLKKSAERGDRIALREKDLGVWQRYSWADFRERAMWVAHGLRSLGLRRIGQTVEVKDNEQTRGMLHRVRHLVKVDG